MSEEKQRFLMRGCLLLWGLIWVSGVAYADMTVLGVRVSGNRRVEKEAILNQILTKTGHGYSSEKVRQSIVNIYELGFFENIVVATQEIPQGVHLTYRVYEKPAIRAIRYEGYKKVDLSDVRGVVDVQIYSILDLNKIKSAKEKITKLYEQKGFFLARVSHRLEEDRKKNEVELVFQIEELDKVKIRKIHFIGNEAFPDDELKSIMATKEKDFFSWLTKSDNYQEDVFKGDLESLIYFYHTKGYVQVKMDPPLVTVSSDKKWIDIMVAVHEGSVYQFGRIDYEGDLIFSKQEFIESRQFEENKQFNRDDLRKEVLRLADKCKDLGYAFANVNVRSNIDEKAKKVDLVFDFEKGQKVYFGKINITGNSNTRDKVIRRELRIHEGDLYNETLLKKSISRIHALGYFSEVTHTKPQGDSLDLLDLNIEVKERSTGALTLGAGWSSVDKIIANAQISHNNLFGRGHEVALNAQLSGRSNRFTFGFTEPYTFDTEWMSGVDAYKTQTDTEDFTELKTGGDMRVGHPIGEYISTYLTYKLEDLRLKNIAPNAGDLIKAEGLVSSILETLAFDKRDNRFEPSKGFYDRMMLEYAGLGGDNHFFKSILESRFYFPAFFDGVFRLNVELGAIARTTSKAIPTNERFKLGGIHSLRGFKPFSIGPREIGTQGASVLVGGDREFFSNIEYELPLIPTMGIKGVLFYDIGSAFDGSRIESIRHDVGFGFRWFSPFGPIRVEVGFPIQPKEGEKKQVVQFAITPPF